LKHCIFIVILFLFFSEMRAQIAVAGKLLDGITREPVPFAVVMDTLSKKGTTSDIDGKFSFSVPHMPCVLRIMSYGYEEKIVNIETSAPQEILLSRRAFQMSQVTILANRENPALRIIRAASAARKLHDPANLPSYTCTSYSKTFVSVEAPADTAKKNRSRKPETKLDSLMSEQYLFLSESVSRIKWKKPLRQETIVASRVAGFRQPSLTLLATQLQSFSFYDDVFVLFDIEYISPLSPAAINRYQYKLTDSIFEDGDTLFIINYEPKKGSTFNGLRGTLHISSNGYAIKNVTAQPVDNQGSVTVSITQRYALVDSTHWFPVQLITEWYNNMLVIRDGELDFNRKPSEADSTLQRTRLVCRSYISDIRIDTNLTRSDFSDTELEIDSAVASRDTAFWNNYRAEPLSKKEATTYQRIDSVGSKLNLDKKLKNIAAALRGKKQIGPVDLDLDKFIDYNHFEGLRLGASAHTNSDLSKHVRFGGYGAYGFRDRQFKYGADAELMVYEKNEVAFYVSWRHDIAETGYSPFRLNTKFTGSENYRKLYRRRFDNIDEYSAGVRFRTMRHFRFDLFARRQFRYVNGDYRFVIHSENASVQLASYELNEVGFSMRFAFRERYGMVLVRHGARRADPAQPDALASAVTGIRIQCRRYSLHANAIPD
jgi:hypothetical protein